MNPKQFSKTMNKIHEAFYQAPLEVINSDKNEMILKSGNDEFCIENHIHTRFRITFPDYTGKISSYRNLFGQIMKNDDNVCDTSDFIDLPLSHVRKIHDFIQKINIKDLEKLKD